MLKRTLYSLFILAYVFTWGSLPISSSPVLAAESVVATRTAATVLVNDAAIPFDAYNIMGNNYFKLRDIAYVLSGTANQFDVTWDGARNAISLLKGTAYDVSEGGPAAANGEATKSATLSTSVIYLDGEAISPTAYNIDGNNYFKLRDLSGAIGFDLDWDDKTSTIAIKATVLTTPQALVTLDNGGSNVAPAPTPESTSGSGATAPTPPGTKPEPPVAIKEPEGVTESTYTPPQTEQTATKPATPYVAPAAAKLGNTLGNLAAGGIVAEADGYIYFAASGGLMKAKTGAQDAAELLILADNISRINVLDGYVYFMNYQGIFRITTAGTGFMTICAEQNLWGAMIVSDAGVFFAQEGKIYRIAHDGSGKKMLYDCGRNLHITELTLIGDRIYFHNNSFYSMKVDGSELEEAKASVFGNSLQYVEGRLYYLSGSSVYSVQMDGAEQRTHYTDSGNIGEVIIDGGYIYFKDYADNSCYRVKLDGTGKTKVGVSPRFYGVVGGAAVMTKGSSTSEYYDQIDTLNREQAERKADEVLAAIIKPGMTELQKEKAINDWLSRNVEYSDAAAGLLGGYVSTGVYPGNDTWQMIKEAGSAYGALVQGEAICSGYARAAELMLTKVGIEALYVTGSFGDGYTGPGHAWNIVKIDGTYYHLDVTMNSSMYDHQTGRFATWTEDDIGHYNLAYRQFNLSDASMGGEPGAYYGYQTRIWDRSKYPACPRTMKKGEYVDMPIRDVLGVDEDVATRLIEEDGIVRWSVSYVPHSIYRAGVVCALSVAPGQKIHRDTELIISISTGVATVPPSNSEPPKDVQSDYFHDITLAEQKQMANAGEEAIFIFYGDDSYSQNYLPLYKEAATEAELHVYGVKVTMEDKWNITFPVVNDSEGNMKLPVIFVYNGQRIATWGERVPTKTEAVELFRGKNSW